MDIIGKKNLYFLISGIIIIPGLISLFLWGLKFGIEFTGGSRLEYSKDAKLKVERIVIEKILKDNTALAHTIAIEENSVSLRTDPLSTDKKNKIDKAVKKEYKTLKEKSFETVGPSIGSETKNNAIKAVLFASVAIALYIAFAFREVSKLVTSWKYGVCAIAALLHDVLVVAGVFSFLGHFAGVEVDSLFITALLTVMGFSVHDTIVVFDRIRENLKKSINVPFEKIVNNSILETLNRSLNTSLTVVLMLFALLLFGGASIYWFVVALLIGIVSGTYSSIFNAAPLLVVWNEMDRRRSKRS